MPNPSCCVRRRMCGNPKKCGFVCVCVCVRTRVADLPAPCAFRHYLQSPYYFMTCSLYDASDDRPVPVAPSTALAGTLVSSLHRLKDVDNSGKSQPQCTSEKGQRADSRQTEGSLSSGISL